VYRLVVKVGGQPRWDGATGRYQQPGEQIVLESGNLEEFKRMVFLHSAHCHIIEGELPNFDQKPTFLQKVVQKVKDVAGVSSGPTFATLKDLQEHNKAEEKAKANPAPEIPEDGPTRCTECQREFKDHAGLVRHQSRSGHGKSEPKE
jgi:hypothetical protein